MADLKYFISVSQRFRAGADYVEEEMIGGRGSLCIPALWCNNGPNVVHFRKHQQNGIRERMTRCDLVFVDKQSNAIEFRNLSQYYH